MHRQRSPFTGGPGGFGATPFNFNAQYSENAGTVFPPMTEGLNGMPFMGQGQSKPTPMMRSINRQRQLAEEGNGLDSLPPLPIINQRMLSNRGVVERGQYGGAPFVPSSYAPYEGDISMTKDSPKGTPKLGYGSMSKPDQSLESKNLLMSLRLGGKGQIADNDTDSEAELCMQVETKDLPVEPRWRSALQVLVEAVPEQRRRSWEASYHRCMQSFFARHLVFLLSLLWMLGSGAMKLASRYSGLMRRWRFGLWRTKFQLRSTMRQLLWRMANAKANDTLVFLLVTLATPWLFIISLIGFGLSFVFTVKTGVSEVVHQVRKRLG